MRVVLTALAARLGLLAFVTGRDLAQGQTMVAVDGAAYVGTHGLEVMSRAARRTVPRRRSRTSPPFGVRPSAPPRWPPSWPGIVTEDKRTVRKCHYRKTADPAAARAAIEEGDRRPGARSRTGDLDRSFRGGGATAAGDQQRDGRDRIP